MTHRDLQAWAGATTVRPADPALGTQIVEALIRVIGKEVITRFEEDPAVLGGVVVRVGDRIFDGSVRRIESAPAHCSG